MQKLIRTLILGIFTAAPAAHALGDCFPSQGDRLQVFAQAPMHADVGAEAMHGVRALHAGEVVTATDVTIRSSIQIWVKVKTADELEGWIYLGYFGDIIHGRSPLCPI